MVAWRWAITAVLVALVPSVAQARPGDLDPSFSRDGYALPSIARTAIPFAVEIDRSGRSIAVGNFGGKNGSQGDAMLIALDRKGRPAAGFGSRGVVVAERPGTQYLYDVAIDDEDRIVAVGRYERDAVVVRFLPDGLSLYVGI